MKSIANKIKKIQDGWFTSLYFIGGNKLAPNWSKNTEW